MTTDGWRALAIAAVRQHDRGEDEMLDSLVQLLVEQDAAKAELQRKGYGCTGMPWLELVADVEDR